MIDSDLADLYGIETKRLKEQVKRNLKRFPEDFMFVLNRNELSYLRSQIATSNRGGSRYYPMAFTEQGVAMFYKSLNKDGKKNRNSGEGEELDFKPVRKRNEQ
jgi:hypothetical protein